MLYRAIALCLLLMVLMELISDLETLKTDDEGVCVVKLSMRQRRRKSFNVYINKWCGKKKCVSKRYKTETYTEWTNHTVCCNGWQHNSDLDICMPVCSTGCNGGKCVAPDLCHCEPPMYLDRERKNNCIRPLCNPPCVNAQCWNGNKCECNHNTTRYNATHCAACDVGYTIAPDLACLPKCDSCINGNCTAPNVCSCYDGYSLNNSTCDPICDTCENGECIAPNECECHEGYTKLDGACKAICRKPCVNGVCSSPNVCSCNEGYTKDASFPEVCYKPCRLECNDSCDLNGECGKTCVPTNLSIVKKKTIVNETICGSSKPCVIKPHKEISYQLSCCFGYEFIEKNDSCVPACKFGCANGTCIAPNTCECKPPLILVNHACVAPICDEPCIHSRCVGNNICSCNDNFIAINATYCAALCPPDYFNDPIECRPKCNKPCINGTCIAPNNCSCNVGYESTNDTFTCKPKCKSCSNGQCIAPDVCTCLDGYNMAGDVCSPKCANTCVNGYCSSPNVCTCKGGYIKNLTEQFSCYKPCKGSCNNGKCNIDGECICDPGYERNNDTCTPMKSVPCEECLISVSRNCTETTCWCEDGRPCFNSLETPEEVASSVRLAGLELTWMYGGAVCLLLIVLVMAVILRSWHKRKEYENKTADDGVVFGSVVYTRPHTLLTSKPEDNIPEDDFYEEVAMDSKGDKATSEGLLISNQNDNAC